MLVDTCRACGKTFDEADRRWDEARLSGKCPFCGATGTLMPAVPQGSGQFGKYRTAWRRFWAALADGLLFSLLLPVNTWIFTHVRIVPVLLAWHIAHSVSFVTYSVLCHGLYGRTLGKLLFGVVVRDISESRLSIRQAALRDVVPLASAPFSLAVEIPYVLRGVNPYGPERSAETSAGLLTWIAFLWFCAELVTMLTNKKRRAVHDFIAGSVVIRRDALAT